MKPWAGLAGDRQPDRQHTEVWQVNADGRLGIAVTDQEDRAEARTATFKYRRREGGINCPDDLATRSNSRLHPTAQRHTSAAVQREVSGGKIRSGDL